MGNSSFVYPADKIPFPMMVFSRGKTCYLQGKFMAPDTVMPDIRRETSIFIQKKDGKSPEGK